jgi:tetratricopeptide (TPR) repeat protein
MRNLFITLMICLILPAVAFAAPVGKVTKAKGNVTFKVVGSAPYKTLAVGQEVSEGNWVKTGKDGWLELTLSDNSRFTIANNSEMEIQSFLVGKTSKTGSFALTQGRLRATVMKLAGQQTDIKVKSGTAVAGVKGTEFLMLSQGPANVFFGNEGTVLVTGTTGDAEGERLPADTMTQNTRGYRPVAAVQVALGTPLAEARKHFEAATAGLPPVEWADSDNIPNIIARWDINHGHYLADAGRYEEALHVFQIAIDLTTLADIRADARLERGGVYGRFLKHPEAALAEYLLVLEEFSASPKREIALYNVGQTLYDMGKDDLAKSRFQQYLKEYPKGRYKGSVQTLLKALDRK